MIDKNDNADPISSIDTVFSQLEQSQPSYPSVQSSRQDALDQLLELFILDENLNILCAAGLFKIDKTRFERILTGLLKEYSKDLLTQRRFDYYEHYQISNAEVLKSHQFFERNAAEFARRIAENFDGDSMKSQQYLSDYHSEIIISVQIVQTALFSDDDQYTVDEKKPGEDGLDSLNVFRLRNFLIKGVAFKHLKVQLSGFIYARINISAIEKYINQVGNSFVRSLGLSVTPRVDDKLNKFLRIYWAWIPIPVHIFWTSSKAGNVVCRSVLSLGDSTFLRHVTVGLGFSAEELRRIRNLLYFVYSINTQRLQAINAIDVGHHKYSKLQAKSLSEISSSEALIMAFKLTILQGHRRKPRPINSAQIVVSPHRHCRLAQLTHSTRQLREDLSYIRAQYSTDIPDRNRSRGSQFSEKSPLVPQGCSVSMQPCSDLFISLTRKVMQSWEALWRPAIPAGYRRLTWICVCHSIIRLN